MPALELTTFVFNKQVNSLHVTHTICTRDFDLCCCCFLPPVVSLGAKPRFPVSSKVSTYYFEVLICVVLGCDIGTIPDADTASLGTYCTVQ